MKEQIKAILTNLGADVCGIANISTFSDTPKGFHPTDIYPDCKSVIVFAKALPKGVTFVNPRIVYQHFNNLGPVELDRIAYLAALEIEKKFQAIVVPLPSDCPYEFWDKENLKGHGLISMKHAAVHAGIGTLGKSTLLINREYGNLLNIGAVMTNLDLESDDPAEDICIKNCRICLDSCPVKAIGENEVNQKLCRPHTFGETARGFGTVNCNQCRVRCPMRFGKK